MDAEDADFLFDTLPFLDRVRTLKSSKRDHSPMTLDKQKLLANRYYIGSNSTLRAGWGHSTIQKAIDHATETVQKPGHEEVFIVKIVRVVRRKAPPVEVEVV